MENIVRLDIADRREQMMLLVAFAGLTLFLAAVGLYGLLSYWVMQHRREIGLRMAIGASPSWMMRMLMRRGASLTTTGLGAGVVVAWAGTRTIETLLYGVTAADPMTISVVVSLIACVTFVATYIPARRATKVDPNVALRCD